MKFKKFMFVWSVLIVTVFLIICLAPKNQTAQITETLKPHHFSVVWKGYIPPYSNQTPDYYICINDLRDEVLNMKIAFQIYNNENQSYWFMIDKYSNAPEGWNITSFCIGNIPVDTSTSFAYQNLWRSKPTTIPSGILTDNVQLVVKAYNDSLYTQFYSQDNFTVPFHFIDRSATVWQTITYDNFEDGRNGNCDYWSGSDVGVVGSNFPYRSYPNTLMTGGWRGWWGSNFVKTFDTRGSGNITESYLVFALYHDAGNYLTIQLNDVDVFKQDVSPGGLGNKWYQYAIPLPVSASVTVNIYGINAQLDDVFVIGK